jgi:hypothetical protein
MTTLKFELNEFIDSFWNILGHESLWRVWTQTFLSLKLTTKANAAPAVIERKFECHFVPAINRKFKRYKFNQVMQKDGEYFTELATIL